jgi:hypothetical protein
MIELTYNSQICNSDKYNISQNNTQIKTIAALNPFNILVSSKIKKTGPIIKLKKIPKELQLKYRLPLKFINTLFFFYDSPSKVFLY